MAIDRVPELNISSDIIELVPAKIARRYGVLPLKLQNNSLVIAVHDPTDTLLLDELRLILGVSELSPVQMSSTELETAIDAYYGLGIQTVEHVLLDIESDLAVAKPSVALADGEDKAADEMANDAPIIKLVNSIVMQAMQKGASDIHIEPFENSIRLRYRIDGLLYEMVAPPRELFPAVLSRIKIMARLNIAEKRLPQDGRIKIEMLGKEVDLRVSTVPTLFGENVVLRVLEQSSISLGLTDLGIPGEMISQFRDLISTTQGIVLVTGPTGSGKTTTLYAALNALNLPEKKIITIEDPVEYRLYGISQIQVKEKIGFGFANALRSILRQDPDIIMVGEIRDLDTARMAIQAALTGHMVLATLHTNDAVSAVSRLVDMGIEPFLVASTVKGILAQRLVRVLCPKCKRKALPTTDDLEQLSIHSKDRYSVGELYESVGCNYCSNIGYHGRTGIFELMVTDTEIRSMVLRNSSADEIRHQAIRMGYETLKEDGIQKAFQGITSLAEVLRVTRD